MSRPVEKKHPCAGLGQSQSLGASKRAERPGEQHLFAVDPHGAPPLQDIRNLLHRGLCDPLVEHDLAARHGDNPIARLQNMMQVMADEDAGDPLRRQAADEAEHFRRLFDRQMIGRFVEDENSRLEMHRARDRHALALSA